MKLFRKIDVETGQFLEDVILTAVPIDEEGNADPQYINVPVPQGFYWPKWNGTEWIEGGESPDPVSQEPTIEERTASLEDAVLMMMME
ncbi:hypothetical protein R0K17_05695 [Planococcus sp. SIMBA_143]